MKTVKYTGSSHLNYDGVLGRSWAPQSMNVVSDAAAQALTQSSYNFVDVTVESPQEWKAGHMAGLRLAVLGSSYVVAGAVTGDGQNGKTWSTNRSIHQWVNARMGRPFARITEYGKNGDAIAYSQNGDGMVNRFLSQVMTAKFKPDYLVLSGHIINSTQSALNVPFEKYVESIEKLCTLTDSFGIGFIVEIDPYVDAMLADESRMTYYYRAVDYLEKLHTRWAHVITVPVHRYFNPRGTTQTSQDRSFTADSTHPTTNGVLHAYLPAYQNALQNRFAIKPLPWKGQRDPFELTYNGRLFGGGNATTNAPDYYWQNGSGFAPGNKGPFGFGITTTGSGITTNSVISSKAPNPLDTEDAYAETVNPCWKLTLSTGSGGTGTFTIFARDHTASYTWSSGGAVANPFRYVKATDPNNPCWYRIIGDGNLSTGSDPTDGWSRDVGTTFTSNTATLLVCDRWNNPGRQAYGLSDVIVDQSAYAPGTLFSVELACGMYNSGNTNQVLAGSSGLFNGVSNAIDPKTVEPFSASFGKVGGIESLGPDTYARLQMATQYDENEYIASNVDYHKRFDTWQLGANSSITLYYVAFGSYFVR